MEELYRKADGSFWGMCSGLKYDKGIAYKDQAGGYWSDEVPASASTELVFIEDDCKSGKGAKNG
jgi:hypothetical protein